MDWTSVGSTSRAASPGNFGHRGNVRREHRHAASHGIQHRHSETLRRARGTRRWKRAGRAASSSESGDVAEHLDILLAGTARNALKSLFGLEAERSRQDELPTRSGVFERFHQAHDILAALDGADAQDHRLARDWRRSTTGAGRAP